MRHDMSQTFMNIYDSNQRPPSLLLIRMRGMGLLQISSPAVLIPSGRAQELSMQIYSTFSPSGGWNIHILYLVKSNNNSYYQMTYDIIRFL